MLCAQRVIPSLAVSRLSWKLVISLPESDESLAVEDQLRSDWLKAKFSKGAVSSSSLDEKVSFIVKMMQITVICNHSIVA